MKKTIQEILNNPTNYKTCKDCKKINLKENKTCIFCNTSNFTNSMKESVKYLKAEFKPSDRSHITEV